MKKMTKITAFIFALCLGATAMTACGSEKESKKTEEKKTEQAADSADEEELEDAEDLDEDETAGYTPTKEIKKADFASGLVQIGDDVFRSGGYITVKEFVEKYGDKFELSYDMHEIDINDECDRYVDSFSADKYDDNDGNYEYSFWVEYENNKDTVGECSIKSINIADRLLISGINKGRDYDYWFPSGIKFQTENKTVDDIIKMFKDYDVVECDDKDDKEGTGINRYWKEKATSVHNEEANQKICFEIKGKEKNLEGTYPVYRYSFYYNADKEEIAFSTLDKVLVE
jgi:hypothetical protein